MIRLRDLSLAKQTENDALKKLSDTLEHKVKVLTKENENAKADITTMQATISDLKEQARRILFDDEHHTISLLLVQVDTCLGAQQMVDLLTNKNLSLEDQVRELQENVDNLVSCRLVVVVVQPSMRLLFETRNHSVTWTKVGRPVMRF